MSGSATTSDRAGSGTRHAAADAAIEAVYQRELRMKPIDELIERSSLGTPAAKRIRALASKRDVDEVLRRTRR